VIRRLVGTVGIAGLVLAGLPAVAAAESPGCATRTNNTFAKLLECVTLGGVREHQAAFQSIADANDGTRAAGTSGYTDSVDYVVDRLTAAGWQVSLDEFPYLYQAPPLLQQLTQVNAVYETGAFTGTGTGNVTGSIVPVDINLVPPRTSTSGCEAADFAGLDFSGPNDIALVQRGSCAFSIKVQNAQAAGAEAVVIFNQGNDPTREGLIVGTLAPFTSAIPVVGASFADGAALAQPGSTAQVTVDPPESRPQVNVIAELPGRSSTVVMAGAHLDSVQEGPGINDNGSGSAALIEVAEQMAKVQPRNTVRLAWWGAEEDGLIGSSEYVNGLSPQELGRIAVYLNFDMIGSPNHVLFIYDGDDSDGVGAGPGPEGSAQIERTFQRYFASQGQPTKGTDFSGRSDYGPFIERGIPAGGLFTGAEGIKTPEEAAIWGGTAGLPYDPCYHLACDTFANNNDIALDLNSDAVAYAVLQYAMNAQEITGDRGKGNFRLAPMRDVA
jgi:Zn-dependent M28 family amino/carboxypeptidase